MRKLIISTAHQENGDFTQHSCFRRSSDVLLQRYNHRSRSVKNMINVSFTAFQLTSGPLWLTQELRSSTRPEMQLHVYLLAGLISTFGLFALLIITIFCGFVCSRQRRGSCFPIHCAISQHATDCVVDHERSVLADVISLPCKALSGK